MRIHHLLVSLVVTVAACGETTTRTIDHAASIPIKPTRPTTKELPHASAVDLCGATAHVPTLTEAQEQLVEDCVPRAGGFACVPRAEASELEGTFWTSTPCELSGQHAFFAGNFSTGEVVCTAAVSSAAQPLCLE